jgi:SAM-dependent methyltransferase
MMIAADSSSWMACFRASEIPWTHAYNDAHRALVGAALDDASLCAAAGSGQRLPPGYGVGFDERVVEYPWLFGRGLSGRVLDAGSTFNHEHILDRVLPLVDELTIVTLEPEAWAYPLRRVSYVYADLRALPFADAHFDLAVSISTLEHIGMDNTMYGVADPPARDPAAEVAEAAAELRRVVRPGGRILLTVPFGRHEDHGWLRQFDAQDLERLVGDFGGRADAEIGFFRYDKRGWQRSAIVDAAGARYRDYTADQSPVADLAAAARAVACVTVSV